MNREKNNDYLNVLPYDILRNELMHKVDRVRHIFEIYRVPLIDGEGLAHSLEEAEAYAKGEKLAGDYSPQMLQRMIHDAHVIWMLAENLETCEKAGIDLRNHLKQIRTGSTDYGTSATDKERKKIFFKDFEYELCIAAAASRKGVAVAFSDKPNDPRGDLRVGTVRVEVKHPDGVKQLKKLARKFNNGLRTEGSYGVFAMGLEDAFEFGEGGEFKDLTNFDAWSDAKKREIEAWGCKFIKFVAKLSNIIATIQTTTQVEFYGEGLSRLRRLSNSLVFDEKPKVPTSAYDDARKIVEVFNPDPRIYSKVKSII